MRRALLDCCLDHLMLEEKLEMSQRAHLHKCGIRQIESCTAVINGNDLRHCQFSSKAATACHCHVIKTAHEKNLGNTMEQCHTVKKGLTFHDMGSVFGVTALPDMH